MKTVAQEDLAPGVEPTAMSPTEDECSPSTRTNDSDGPDVPSVDTPSPPPSPTTTSPSSSSRGLKLFHWSVNSPSTERSKTPTSTSGLAALQQYQYKKEGFSSITKTSPLHLSSTDGDLEGKDDLPDSPPSQDSAYFSQSQPHSSSLKEEEVLTNSFPSSIPEDVPSVRLYKSLLPVKVYTSFVFGSAFTQTVYRKIVWSYGCVFLHVLPFMCSHSLRK